MTIPWGAYAHFGSSPRLAQSCVASVCCLSFTALFRAMQHVDLVSDDDDARDVKMAKRKERHLIEQAKARAMQRVDLVSMEMNPE